MDARTLEIVAPAGTLTSGIYALDAGADAVYFGLSRFSARQAAENLSVSDARRLKGVADERGKRIYAAINTVIAEDELPLLARFMTELALLEVDAVLVQDLGVARYIKERFPAVPVHGSTQLAVHTGAGLEAAEAMGLERVVLSRELGVDDIGALGYVAPGVEREVFAHGALCYGFSGLCLASSALTRRSSNRGACAQICRSWFETQKRRGYFFSAADLEAGELIFELRSLGVSAIKIEGRLKSPAYAFNTTAYYRALLDGDPERAAHFRDLSALAFARTRSPGFLAKAPSKRLVNQAYPSHLGIDGATVVARRGGDIDIRALSDLFAHDRLFLPPEGPPDEGITLSLSGFRHRGKTLRHLKRGETATIPGPRGVRVGDTLKKTLSHDMHLKSLPAGRYPERKRQLSLSAGLSEDGIRLGTEVGGVAVARAYLVTLETRRAGEPFDAVLRSRLAGSCDHGFAFDSVTPFSGKPPVPSDLFVPPSELKRVRNAFFCDVEEALLEAAAAPPDLSALEAYAEPLPPRSRIVYPDGFPFVAETALTEAASWPLIGGYRYLSLPPVTFDAEKTLSRLRSEIEKHSGERFRVGLSNVGHIATARAWRELDHVTFYLDYGQYAANVWTLVALQRLVPRLTGAYLWGEADDTQKAALTASISAALGGVPPGIRDIDCPDRFPLFISRICFRGFPGKPACNERCSGTFDKQIRQNRRRFDVKVRDCITYVFSADGVTREGSRGAIDPAGSD